MKEPGELEKLNAVAQVLWIESQFEKTRIIWPLLSVVCIGLAIASHGNGNWESKGVAVLALLLVAFTICVYSGWRYAPAVGFGILPFVYLGNCFNVSHTRMGIFTILALMAAAIWQVIDSARMVLAVHRSSSPECEPEVQRVGRWISRLASAVTVPEMIEFESGDFWTDGRGISRVMKQEEYIVLAYFHRKNLSKLPRLSIFDASTPILFSPDQHRLRIGKRKFRKVEFTLESAASAQQIAQVVSTV